MSIRYLFGPLPPESGFPLSNLQPLMDTGTLVPFSLVPREPSVLTVDWNDSWEGLLSRCPTGFQPDFIGVPLAYQAIPTWLYRAPVPLVGVAADWSLLFHQYRLQLPWLDAVLTDQPGVDVFSRMGCNHVYSTNLYGLDPAFPLVDADDTTERPYDVLFAGNFGVVQAGRLPWLARLAALADKYRILLATGVPRADYPFLMRKAKIAFNFSQRRECNLRVFEAAGAGCLLFQEADCTEVADYFTDRQECVRYHSHDLEALLEHYLTHDDERRAIARAARLKVTEFTYPALWQRGLESLQSNWPTIQQRAAQRLERTEPPSLTLRVWCQAGAVVPDPTMLADVNRSLEQHPDDATLHHFAAVAHSQQPRNEVSLDAVGTHLSAALQRQPEHPLLLAQLSYLLSAADQHDAAERTALRTLRLLDDPNPATLALLRETPLLPPGFDVFRVEWEKAAWTSPDDEIAAKRNLLRWWLHSLRGQRSGHVTPWFEAVLARPDLPLSQASLGCALARSRIFFEAIDHLRAAVQSNPFDHEAARALYQVLRDAGDPVGAEEVRQAHRRLHTIAPGLIPQHPWFLVEPTPTPAPVAESSRPTGNELASIIILCCNEVGLTRACLESIRRHTRAPYELILVDNGSTDDTSAFLAEVGHWREPARVRVIRNDTNRGFSAGCNQGLRESQGHYLVLLNNDTIVTPSWLDRLIDWSLHEWPSVGLVGPVSNYAPPPQYVEHAYETLEQLDAFAQHRRQQFAAQAVRTDRLTGFCLLLRREVIEKIGLLDERFGPGFFEDDDLCIRAREAGFGLLVALDAYIHHFGSRTFAALGIDAQAQLRSNWEQFVQKWGPEKTAGYHPPPAREPSRALHQPNVVPQASGTKQRVSLTMIVRNEENNLRDCLASVRDLVDEMIVVDTGSTDRTKDIAVEMGAKVYDFPWVDSFAAARNEALKHATGDWIFWLDADDRIDPANREQLRSLFASLPPTQQVAFSMKCACLPDPQARSATVVDHVRLFRRHPAIRWIFRVHEQILPSIRELGGEVIEAKVVITHIGYQDPALRRRKLERDLRLLRMELEDHPEHPFALFNLGSVLHELGQVPSDAASFCFWSRFGSNSWHSQIGRFGLPRSLQRLGRGEPLQMSQGILRRPIGFGPLVEGAFQHSERREVADLPQIEPDDMIDGRQL